MPTVSVCIPSYNYAQYLPKAIKGILEQTYTDFELIIVDDCSSENIAEIVQSIKDSRIRFIQNRKNLGIPHNWNRCLEEARGQYICILHADDWWEKTYLETMVGVLNRNSKVGMVFSSFYIYFQNKQASRLIQHFPRDRLFNGETFFTINVKENIVGTPTVMVRRECYQKLGPFDTQFRILQDWEMWLRIALHYDIAYVANPLGHWRAHGSNFSTIDRTEDRLFSEKSKLLQKVFKNFSPQKKHLLSLYKETRLTFAKQLYGFALKLELVRGHTKMFRKQSWLAIRLSPDIMIKTLILPKIGLSYSGTFLIELLRKFKRRAIFGKTL